MGTIAQQCPKLDFKHHWCAKNMWSYSIETKEVRKQAKV